MTQRSLARAAHLLDRVSGPISRAGKWVGIVMLVIIMFLITVDVIMRGGFNAPIMGSYEMAEFIMVPLVFFALFYTAYEKGHVAVSVVADRLSQRAQAVVYSIGYLLALALFALVTWQSITYGLRLWNSGEVSLALGIPSYPFAFVVAFGSTLLCLVLLANFVESLANISKR